MTSHTLGGIHPSISGGYSANRKMDRVFTQSGGSQTTTSRYGRHGRNGRAGVSGMEYMMNPLAGGFDQFPPTHYRTISGGGDLDEYDDYIPPPRNYGYERQSSGRRLRGQNGNYNVSHQNDVNRRYNPPRRMDMRNQMFDAPPPPRNRYPRETARRRQSFRGSNDNRFHDDEHNYQGQRKPMNRQRQNTRTRNSITEQPHREQNNNDETRRARLASAGRRRRNTSSINGPTTQNKEQPPVAPANRNRRFACNLCRQVFRSDNLRVRHIRAFHARKRDFVCKECRGVFPSAKSITLHLSQPHPEERQAVSETRRFPSLGVPIRYIPDGMTIFSCQYCPFGFINASDAESHEGRCRASQRLSINIDLEYPGNDQYTMYCFCCPELLSLRQGIKEHFECLHGFVNLTISYYCALCPKKFANEEDASEHYNKNHKKEQIVALYSERQEQFIDESLKSYQSTRPISVVRAKAEVRQIMAKLLRQVTAKVKSS